MRKTLISIAVVLGGLFTAQVVFGGITGSKGALQINAGADQGYDVLEVGADGKVLMASSTASLGVSWETVVGGSGVTSLNGSTSSTQTFSASTGTGISTANGVHTFTNTRPFTTSTFNGSLGITWTATGTVSQIAADVSGSATTLRLQMAGGTCTGNDKISSISATGTVICTTDQTGGAGSALVNPSEIVLVSGPVVWTNMAIATSEFGGSAASSSLYRTKYDFTSSTSFRLIKTGQIVACSAATSRLFVMYSSSTTGNDVPASPWSVLNGGTTTTESVSCGTTGASSTAWMSVTAGAKREVWLKLEGSGGNGTADPNFGSINLQVK